MHVCLTRRQPPAKGWRLKLSLNRYIFASLDNFREWGVCFGDVWLAAGDAWRHEMAIASCTGIDGRR